LQLVELLAVKSGKLDKLDKLDSSWHDRWKSRSLFTCQNDRPRAMQPEVQAVFGMRLERLASSNMAAIVSSTENAESRLRAIAHL
jgi:hypothetical protein